MVLQLESFIRQKSLPAKLHLRKKIERRCFQGEHIGGKRWKCKRIELNALAKSPDRFIEWIEAKLQQHGLDRRLVPPDRYITKHAVDRRRERLREQVSECVASALYLEALEEGIVDGLLSRISLDGVADDLKAWAPKLESGRWCNRVDRFVDRLVAGLGDEIHTATVAAIKKMEFPE